MIDAGACFGPNITQFQRKKVIGMINMKVACIGAASLLLSACSSMYYNAMEKVGVHKRDILVDRVVEARDSQQEAQVEFKDALEQFGSVVTLQETKLKAAYDKLSAEYEDAEEAAEEVRNRVDSVESVAEALFDEWADEIDQYTNANLARSSKAQMKSTQRRYKEMLASMRRAEKSMDPVLRTFRDNVLFLKHNLNAQAIGSLHGEFSTLSRDIESLIGTMNRSIEESNAFIASMKQN